MDKKVIIRNFSRFAHIYDRYADMQEEAALELLREIQEDNYKSILEIGCGTGNYTRLLREKFKTAKLKALDISERMIEVAQKKLKDKEIEFIVADAEDINLDEDFDLITSNACFQWFEDLDRALIKYKNLLKRGGIISFSTFGPQTFRELNTSLRHILKNVSVSATDFLNKEKIREMLKRSYKKIIMRENRYLEPNSCLRELLRKIKYTGVIGEGLNGKVFFSSQLVNRLEQIYLDKFKQIIATYQIFFFQGRL